MVNQKQPAGLYVLAFTEVFERLSYYTLSYLLVLYASATPAAGGLGWSKESALTLMGLYTMAAFTLPIIGAYLADSFLGRYRAAFLGGIIIILGHFCMLFSASQPLLYLALTLVASGTAFFKPCMPALLGLLYAPEDIRRELGFNWYFLGVNVGGVAAGIISGLLMQRYGFQIALASASLGMVIGMIVFCLGRKHLVHDEVIKTSSSIALNSKPAAHCPLEKKAIACIGLALAFFALWGIVYNIAIGGTLSLYIENYTDKNILSYEIPTTFFQSLEGLVILFFTPIFTLILAGLAAKKCYPNEFSQMNLALVFSAIAVFYFAYLAHIGQSALPGEKPFYWTQMAFFMTVVGISEVMISPVMMSTISMLAPNRYKALFQAFYLACIGITGVLAAKIGAVSLTSPVATFVVLGIILSTGAGCYFLCKGKMIKTAHQFALENQC